MTPIAAASKIERNCRSLAASAASARLRSVMSTITPCQYRVPVAGSVTTAAFSLTHTTLPSRATMRYSANRAERVRRARSSAATIRSESSGWTTSSQSSSSVSHSSRGYPRRSSTWGLM